jgi:imidazolonepropionase
LRRHGIAMAIATDCNPGTSPPLPADGHEHGGNVVSHDGRRASSSGSRAQPRRRSGWHAAARSNLQQCDLAIWNVGRPAELVYAMGANPLHSRVWKGE